MGRQAHSFDEDAPDTVQIMHKVAGNSHIFTSPDLPGLHIGHPNLAVAFGLIPDAVSGIVRGTCGAEVEYKTTVSLTEFEAALGQEAEVAVANLLAPSFCAVIDRHGRAA